ncbi:MAG: NAD-dependent epimerase/dehydratase family protein [Candidatus Carbobacillus altaicus]|nr:NAD-dependent epimerase/dehydratase family protein [Candidatus Carbobacillus altaicus]
MTKILVTGSLGQIGSELVPALRARYGVEKVVATDIRPPEEVTIDGPYAVLNVTEANDWEEALAKDQFDTIIHLAAILSARGEMKPLQTWDINMTGTMHALEAARAYGMKIFAPSSIAVFGVGTPKTMTPSYTVMRPQTMYGVTKVAMELLFDYYYHKFGVDTRSLRFPGIISYRTPPGGGTTDYAVEMIREAVKRGHYTSFVGPETQLDFMYMPDAISAMIALIEAESDRLKHRNAYNVTAMRFTPEMLGREIKRHLPDFTWDYAVDPLRQRIADSWPDAVDPADAVAEWGFKTSYDLSRMVEDMIRALKTSQEHAPAHM